MQLGIKMVNPYPALTPLTGPHPGDDKLAGVSLNVRAHAAVSKAGRQAPRSGFVFTHRGYSGPSILDLSHHAVKALDHGQCQHPSIAINWTGDSAETWHERIQASSAQRRRVASVLREHLPQRLAAALSSELHIIDKNCADLTKGNRQALISALVSYGLPYNGHQGYDLRVLCMKGCEHLIQWCELVGPAGRHLCLHRRL
jgi:predicted flavoprotein YhiN